MSGNNKTLKLLVTFTIIVCTLSNPYFSQGNAESSVGNPKVEKARLMMGSEGSPIGMEKKGLAISCGNLIQMVDKRLSKLEQAGVKRLQVVSNIEKSFQNRIESLKLISKDTTQVEKNFEIFEQKINEYYSQRSLLVDRLQSVRDRDCLDSDLDSKKLLIGDIKAFNQDFKSHLQDFRSLNSYFKESIILELRKLRGYE